MASRENCWALGFGLFVLLAVFVLFLPLSLHPSSHLPDDGDALQGACVLAWVAHQAVRSPFELFEMNLYYPHPKGLAYSEHLIPQGLVIAFFLKLGLGLIAATNLLAALTIVSIALSVSLWARELGASRRTAMVAGLVCALSTMTLEEVSRVQMLWMQWIPLGLFFLHRFFRGGSLAAACGFAICFFLQGLSGQYYLVSFPLYLLPVLGGYLVLFPERRTLRDGFRLGVPVAVASLLLVPVEWQYLTLFSRYGFTRPLANGTDLLRYVVPPGNNLLYGELFRDLSSTRSANHHFIGFVTLGLAAFGVWTLFVASGEVSRARHYRALGSIFAIVGVFFLMLSGGAQLTLGGRDLGPGPFRLLYLYVPFFDYTRAPERLSVYFVLGLALLAGLGASSVMSRARGGPATKALLFAILCITLPLEHARRGSYTRIPTSDEIPEVYRWLAETPGDFAIAELPVHPRKFARFFGYESYFATLHWKRILFGKASFTPPAFEYIHWTLSRFPSREATRLLQALGVRAVVYHPHRDQNPDEVIRRLHRNPHFAFIRSFGGASPVVQRLAYGDEMVFQVVAQPPPPRPPASIRERPIARERWTFQTSSATADAKLAVDGLVRTSWGSGAEQQKGQFFEVDLNGEHEVSRISLGFASPYTGFPRALSVNGFHRSRRWERLAFDEDPWEPSRIVAQLVDDPSQATLDLVLQNPVRLERVRLFIRETDPRDELPEWRIPEIRIFEAQPP